MEGQYAGVEVLGILPEPITGRALPSYAEFNLSFDEMETVVRNNRMDWQTALSNVKGVYLITDLKTEERYVSPALWQGGIWPRGARTPATDGRGGNVELHSRVDKTGLGYCRAHFRMTLNVGDREALATLACLGCRASTVGARFHLAATPALSKPRHEVRSH